MAKLQRKTHGEVLTPDWLIDKMLKQAGDLTGKKVADLGANRGQFLKRAMLMYPGIDPRDWTLLEVQERYHRYHRRYTGWRVEETLTEPVNILLGNPPYNSGLHLKLILKYLPLVRERVLVVHPSTWLIDVKTQLDPKSGNPLFRKFRDAVAPYVRSEEMFNGNPVFGIGLFVPCVVTELDMGWVRPQGTSISVKDVGQEEYREVFGLEDITLHGKDWDPTVKEFMGRVQELCAMNGSLWKDPHMLRVLPPSTQFPVQLAAVIGNWNASSALKMVKDDFYTFVMKDPEGNKGIRQGDLDRPGNPTPTYAFTSEVERENFLGYIQCDFPRLCLSILKTNQHMSTGALSLVPWLDFTRSWNDDQLFSMLGYPKGHPIREYAKQFLPDYHNIYPNGKTY